MMVKGHELAEKSYIYNIDSYYIVYVSNFIEKQELIRQSFNVNYIYEEAKDDREPIICAAVNYYNKIVPVCFNMEYWWNIFEPFELLDPSGNKALSIMYEANSPGDKRIIELLGHSDLVIGKDLVIPIIDELIGMID